MAVALGYLHHIYAQCRDLVMHKAICPPSYWSYHLESDRFELHSSVAPGSIPKLKTLPRLSSKFVLLNVVTTPRGISQEQASA